MDIRIIGAGLAGTEAAWQLAKEGFQVKLYEMKPLRFSPAHQSGQLAELVCSNSLRGVITSYSIHYTKLYDGVGRSLNCSSSLVR